MRHRSSPIRTGRCLLAALLGAGLILLATDCLAGVIR